jgi:Domain of unknown function (DUF1824)
MPNSRLSNLTVEEAHSSLKQFDCLKPDVVVDRDRLRQALLLVAAQSDYQILGICAETFAQGCQALQDYASALGYALSLNLSRIEGSTYIKFNPRLDSCYVDAYTGAYRGVLVSCQSDDTAGINEMYGHLPLNLFAESERKD